METESAFKEQDHQYFEIDGGGKRKHSSLKQMWHQGLGQERRKKLLELVVGITRITRRIHFRFFPYALPLKT